MNSSMLDESCDDNYDRKLLKRIQGLFITKINPLNFLSIVHTFRQHENVLTIAEVQELRKKHQFHGDDHVNLDLLYALSRYKGWFSCILDVCQHPDVKQDTLVPDFVKLKDELEEELGIAQGEEIRGEVEEVIPVNETSKDENTFVKVVVAGSDVCDGGEALQDDGASAEASVDDLADCLADLTVGEEFVMNNGKGYCNVCQIALTSEKHKDDHIQGRQHQKRIERRLSVKFMVSASNTAGDIGDEDYMQNRDGSGFCKLCELSLTSPEHARQHLQGRHHRNKKQARMAPAVALPLPVSLGPNGELYILDERGGHCYICNLPFTSKTHGKSHVSGKKHKNKCAGITKAK